MAKKSKGTTLKIPLDELLDFRCPKTKHLRGYPDNWTIINNTIVILPICSICHTILTGDIKGHLKTHEINIKEYLKKYPDSETDKRAVSRCKICNSTERFRIDAQILNLYKIEDIMKYTDFTAEEIKEHAHHILSYRLVNHFSLARAVVDGGNDEIKSYSMHALNRLIAQIETSGVLKNVRPKDVIEALKLINDINKNDKPVKGELEVNHTINVKDILKAIKDVKENEEDGD